MDAGGHAARPLAVVVGAGPAGLMAAEVLADGGARVEVHDAMPAAGRKLLVAGRGGLNLTHSEPIAGFVRRYGARAEALAPYLARFGPGELRAWADALGAETFVGTSGRVFPKAMNAAGLLKAWTDRLRSLGVGLRFRSRWQGWDDAGRLRFVGQPGVAAGTTVLALGGGSWPETGSDGGWVAALAARGVAVAPFTPANSGFEIAWPAGLADRVAGEPLKNVALSCGDERAVGELVLTAYGIEGGAVYALSRAVRAAIAAQGEATVRLDLKPDAAEADLARRLARPRGDASWSTFARKALRLPTQAWALVRAVAGVAATSEPAGLAAAVKALPLLCARPRPLAEAISSAGGVDFAAVDRQLMLRAQPGCFVAGEMLDWEAPTGGYLLQACFSTGFCAGQAALEWLRRGHG